MDSSRAVLVMMLDLSAAFDTIDGHLLTKTLNVRFGVTETALRWFESHLSGRTYHVRIGTAASSGWHVSHVVPQGSVLGPLLYSPFTLPHCLTSWGSSGVGYIPPLCGRSAALCLLCFSWYVHPRSSCKRGRPDGTWGGAMFFPLCKLFFRS